METAATEWTEWVVHTILFWEEDPVRKGKILRYIHDFMSNALIVLIVISHTLYPAFWLQTVILCICILVWLQHLACNGCIVSKVEQKLIGDTRSFATPILEVYHIEPTKELTSALVILGSSVSVFFLSLEWFARVHHKLLPLFTYGMSRIKQNGIVFT
jgi:hypothetical protein